MINLSKKKLQNSSVLIGKNNFVSYNFLEKESYNIRKKIKENSLVIFFANNDAESIILYYALLKHNVTILLLDDALNLREALKYIKDYKPSYVLFPKKNNYEINNFEIIFENSKFYLSKNIERLNYLLNNNIKFLLTTSGTTRDPKCAKITFESIKKNTESIIEYLQINSKDRTVTTMPLNYSYGLSVINSHFMAGASIIPTNYSIIEKKFWDLIIKNRITNLNGVPYFYEILNRIGLDRLDKLKQLRFLTQAGGGLNQNVFLSLRNYCQKNKKLFYLMYGQTEASPRISYIKVNKNLLKPSIGKALPSGKLYLVNNNNNINKINTEGELRYEGPNIFSGYAKNFKDLKKLEKIKYLNTGDLGIFDKRGNFYITGRKNRSIKLFGYRINLDHIEDMLRSKKSNVATIFYKDKIYIFSEKKINNFRKINIPKNKIINHVLIKLPQLKNNKIDYKKLEKKINDSKIF
jgi:long-chain acyl-CoA synthetase